MKSIIIPVDVFWCKSPERPDNCLKLLFRESWEGTNFIRNIFKLFVNGRNVKVYFHKPLETNDIFTSLGSDKTLVLKTERLLRARFRKNRKAYLGPDISNRRTLVSSILNSNSVKIFIEEESRGNQKKTANLSKKENKIYLGNLFLYVLSIYLYFR